MMLNFLPLQFNYDFVLSQTIMLIPKGLARRVRAWPLS